LSSEPFAPWAKEFSLFQPLTNSLVNSWNTLISVIFGSVAGFAFLEFHTTLIKQRDRTLRYLLFRSLVFFSSFTFFVYDWAVLNGLMQIYPYQGTAFSALRFGDDVVMSFLLLGITWNAARPELEERPKLLLTFLTGWHILAAVWHLLAVSQYGWQKIEYRVLGWHLIVAPSVYWGSYLLTNRLSAKAEQSTRNRRILVVMSLEIFCLSVTRLVLFYAV
jgi:hypothetical protein